MTSGVGPRPCHALVVEDDPAICSLFRTILRREGFSVEDCRTGSEAIARIGPDGYHLIVIDLRRPETHGGEVISYLKTHHLQVLKTVIVVSADRSVIRGEYPEPICRFLSKPFDIEEFTHLVHACTELCDREAAAAVNR
ncbi:MAG: hypothetical protein DMF58_10145 [Acidobacteria bacterium]|nr:MAG: hypothetical protein DMF58_10145 [Acidobacteriota bacterium]